MSKACPHILSVSSTTQTPNPNYTMRTNTIISTLIACIALVGFQLNANGQTTNTNKILIDLGNQIKTHIANNQPMNNNNLTAQALVVKIIKNAGYEDFINGMPKGANCTGTSSDSITITKTGSFTITLGATGAKIIGEIGAGYSESSTKTFTTSLTWTSYAQKNADGTVDMNAPIAVDYSYTIGGTTRTGTIKIFVTPQMLKDMNKPPGVTLPTPGPSIQFKLSRKELPAAWQNLLAKGQNIMLSIYFSASSNTYWYTATKTTLNGYVEIGELQVLEYIDSSGKPKADSATLLFSSKSPIGKDLDGNPVFPIEDDMGMKKVIPLNYGIPDWMSRISIQSGGSVEIPATPVIPPELSPQTQMPMFDDVSFR